MFQNGSKYDYHFIIEELAKKFEGQFESLGEDTEKYITFCISTEKKIENDKTIQQKKKLKMIRQLHKK